MIGRDEKPVLEVFFGEIKISAVYYGERQVWPEISSVDPDPGTDPDDPDPDDPDDPEKDVSCYGSGQWLNLKPWRNADPWLNFK